ncbi:OmpA family protein [Sphingomonas sp.]|uniref:OmpA family protein n=1 Tax=Sphingomonas sp. TaxID=28214 RepID=UPI002DD649EF|nr:OmpA family protein [Sphingomonas sp.]
MRKLAVVLTLASTALATPALARDNSWYVGVEGGAQIVEDIDFDITTAAGVRTANAGTADHRYGFDAGGIIGYDFGMFRAEAEVAYKQAGVDAWRSSLTTPAYAANNTLYNVASGLYNYAGGKTSALSFMVNALLDFGDDDGVQGFLGGGAGVARVKADGYALNTRGAFLDDSDTVFAWQALAGIRAPLGDHLEASLKYRFFNADDVRLVDVSGRTFDGRYRSHSILGGLIYNFGAPEAPTPPPPPPPPPPVTPPPPPPPPPPVTQVPCTPGPYIVFFEWDRSDITPEAAGILDNAVSAYGACGQAQVMLAGHADRSGSASYNVGLSQRRADSVRSYLTSRGIGDGVISSEAFGESRPRVDTADGVRELQNRRVEITYGPGSGM